MQLYLLTDYKNRFGSKWKDDPYRSGFDLRLLAESFARHGYAVEFVPLSKIFAGKEAWKRRLVLYTSSEEFGRNYKCYIEDVVDGSGGSGGLFAAARGLSPRSRQ